MPAAFSCANAAEWYVDRHVAGGNGARRAFLAGETTWTYADLLERVERAAFALGDAGVRPLDRVLLALPDSLDAVALLLGAMRMGAIPAPVHASLAEDEYARICADCRPAAAVARDEALAGRLRRVRAAVRWPERIVTVAADTAEEGVASLAPAMASGGRCDPAPAQPDDVALIQYTSGSTGTPKGVVHLHRGLLALPEGFGRRLALTPEDLCFSAAKLAFGYGLGNSVLFPLAAGAAALLRAEPTDPVGVLSTIHAARPTVVFGGPALYAAMLPAIGERFDLSSVRLYVSAGEALGAELFHRWQRAVGPPILDGLGSTECLHIFIAGEPDDLRAGRLGTVVPPYEARLVDDAGVAVGAGTVGQLEIRGPANGARYWERPNATRDAMGDGWVRTGDLLEQDEGGAFRYVGRSDDVFKVRGMKVAPLEVEQCLGEHAAVLESVVVPSVDRHGLATVCAFVRLAPGWEPGPDAARALRAHVRASLTAHKVPKRVEFVEQMPRNGNGKLTRNVLRAHAEERSNDWSGRRPCPELS